VKSLEDIIAGCKKKKAWAQAELFEMFSDKMFGTCLYYTDNKEDAEDLLHDGFLKIFDNIGNYSQDKFEAWMRKIFINIALMRVRRMKLAKEIDEINSFTLSSIPFVENTEMQANDLIALIMKLPTQYRMVFNLYAIEGYKHREIADMLGINEGTSKSNLSRARQILQSQLLVQEIDFK